MKIQHALFDAAEVLVLLGRLASLNGRVMQELLEVRKLLEEVKAQ